MEASLVSHMRRYKNNGKDETEMRSRRNQVTVRLRKSKRDELMLERRNIPDYDLNSNEDDMFKGEMSLKQLIEVVGDFSRPDQQLLAIQLLRKKVNSGVDAPTNELIQMGILSTLVGCLIQRQNPKLQFEAACILTRIVSGTSEQTKLVVAAGAVPSLIQLLSSPILKVCEQSVWALGNIIGDGPELREWVINAGIVRPLLKFLDSELSASFLRRIAWVLVNLCRDMGPPSPPVTTIFEILPALDALIDHKDINVLICCMWTLLFLTDCGAEPIEMIIQSNILHKVALLLHHDEEKIQIAALRIVSNILSSSDERREQLLNSGLLLYFPTLLSHKNRKVRKRAIWFISIITAGNEDHIQAVIDAGLLPKIIENLSSEVFKIQEVAVWAIINLILNGNRRQVFTLIKEGVMGPFCDTLTCQNSEVINAVLSGLNRILEMAGSEVITVANMIEECKGLDKIEFLQQHGNLTIYKLAYEIIDKYFSDKSEQSKLQPEVHGNEFIFGVNEENFPISKYHF